MSHQKRIISILCSTVLSCYLLLFMEWLFHVTKPSFLSTSSGLQRFAVLLLSPLLPIALSVIIIACVVLSLRCFDKFSFLLHIARLIPALFLTSTVFLLIDNFTYTVFHFGVISTHGWWRYCYALLYLGIGVLVYLCLARHELAAKTTQQLPARYFLALSLVILSLTALFFNVSVGDNSKEDYLTERESKEKSLPNIILLSTDGLNASNTSLYGYQRDTTPFLRKLGEASLVFENSFTNCGNTACSISSILSGKLPTQTKLVYPPDILQGKDSYQHLPGILRHLGYYNVDISIRHYADAYDLGMRYAFDEANHREIHDYKLAFVPQALFRRFGLIEYFVTQVYQRLESRLLHSFGVQEMVDVYDEVVQSKHVQLRDPERVNYILDVIDRAPRPFFLHVHLLGTHGPKYKVLERVYSQSKEQEKQWDIDFRDDAIKDFDYYLQRIVTRLVKRRLLNKTLLIVHTDHGQKNITRNRLPLLIRFPNKEYVGRISSNAQNLDIAPTILDYLKLQKPEWMSGESLLRETKSELRPIISVSANSQWLTKVTEGYIKPAMLSPIEGLRDITAVICDQFYRLDFQHQKFAHGKVDRHTKPCANDAVPAPEEVKQLLLNHLTKEGFDLSLVKVPQ